MSESVVNPNDLLSVLDGMRQVLETVAGYRSMCREHGFNEESAEIMALEFHKNMLAKTFEPSK